MELLLPVLVRPNIYVPHGPHTEKLLFAHIWLPAEIRDLKPFSMTTSFTTVVVVLLRATPLVPAPALLLPVMLLQTARPLAPSKPYRTPRVVPLHVVDPPPNLLAPPQPEQLLETLVLPY